jgi:hypothetical protein
MISPDGDVVMKSETRAFLRCVPSMCAIGAGAAAIAVPAVRAQASAGVIDHSAINVAAILFGIAAMVYGLSNLKKATVDLQ